MKPSEQFFALVREFEGFRSSPYLCPAGVPTIGYGSTRYENGLPVQLADPAITVQRAEQMLAAATREYADAVHRYVKVPLTQGQFDALVDFAYNAGVQNLRTSTLLRKLNARNYAGAAAEFGQWVYANGKKLPGLVCRREAERQLFVRSS